MESKKGIYILLPVVLIIWGSVAYQFFSFSKTETKVGDAVYSDLQPLQVNPRDTFEININYRDPFLGRMYSTDPIPKKIVRTHGSKVKSSPTPTILQTVVYKGIVSDTKDKTKVFMLIINGHTYLMKKGDTENEVYLKAGNKESITVKNKGVLETIALQV